MPAAPEKKTLLVIHPGALGDVVLAFAAVEALGARFEAVHLLCQEQIGRVAEKLEVVDRAFALESARFAELYGSFSAGLKHWFSAYQAVLVLSVTRTLAEQIRSHFHGALLWVPPRPAPGACCHTADHLLGRLVESRWIDMPARVRHRDRCSPKADPGLVFLHPGAGSPAKRWPLERFFDLARELVDTGATPSFFLGPAEMDLKEKIRAKGWPLFSTESLDALVDRLREAGAFVGNDSGVSHLAAFLGLPTVAVFGSTDPVMWAPRGNAVAVVAPQKGGPVSVTRVLESLTRLRKDPDPVLRTRIVRR